MLADSHCHLDMLQDPEKAVERALALGVGAMLTNATGQQSMAASLSLAGKFGAVKCALGLHPERVLLATQQELALAFAQVERFIPAASAVGEVGLDFKYAKTPVQRALQEDAFRNFISIATRAGKPLVVHARYAQTRSLDILEETGARKVQMHWFTSSAKTCARAVSLGYSISCGPAIISDAQSAQVVKGIPLENLLLETDAPVQFLGKESEPSWIPLVCSKVAELKGTSFGEVARVTTRNFSRLFG